MPHNRHRRSRRDAFDRADLSTDLEPFGTGGSADVYRCRTPDHRSWVFKEYHPDTLSSLDEVALLKTVAYPATLSDDDQRALLAVCAWPRYVVEDGGNIVGVLMAEAPPQFLRAVGNNEKVPRQFDVVIAGQGYAAKRADREYFAIPQRMARLGILLEHLAVLHSLNVIVGDLQPKNLLTNSIAGDSYGRHYPQIFLLDCDAYTVEGRAALPVADPIPWKSPYSSAFTTDTDLYKFALLSMRCFAQDAAVTAVGLSAFSRILKTHEIALLQELLASGSSGITSESLRSMARAWSQAVSRNGKMWRHDDEFGRVPWVEDPPAVVSAAPAADPLAQTDSDNTPRTSYVSSRRRMKAIAALAFVAIVIVAAVIIAVVVTKS